MTGLLGAALAAGGGFLLGQSRGRLLLHRRDILRRAGRDLEEAARLIEWQGLPLPDLISRLAAGEGELAALWAGCGAALDSPDRPAFPDVWDGEVQRADFPLSREEESLLREAGMLLGRFSRDEQAAALLELARRLGQAADRVEEDWRRLNRVYCTLGGCGGLLVAILLL